MAPFFQLSNLFKPRVGVSLSNLQKVGKVDDHLRLDSFQSRSNHEGIKTHMIFPSNWGWYNPSSGRYVTSFFCEKNLHFQLFDWLPVGTFAINQVVTTVVTICWASNPQLSPWMMTWQKPWPCRWSHPWRTYLCRSTKDESLEDDIWCWGQIKELNLSFVHPRHWKIREQLKNWIWQKILKIGNGNLR